MPTFAMKLKTTMFNTKNLIIMRVQNCFKNVFTYAFGVENWSREFLPTYQWAYTFVSDFAIADFVDGANAVTETYNRVIKSWASDYKALTEIVISLNVLSWANDALMRQCYEGRDEFIKLYADLYYKARDEFYNLYGKDKEKSQYFFEMTD